MSKFRFVVAVLAATGLLAIGLVLGRLGGAFLGRSSQTTWSTATLLKQVQELSQLVTVKYVLEKVVVLEDQKLMYGVPVPFGENRVLLLAHGSVSAGINLKELQPGDLEIRGNKITIKLPPARIMYPYLDEKETQVIERTTGLLRSFDKTMEQSARLQAVDDLQRAARNGGILKEADQRGQEQIKALFNQLGFDVEFRAP